MSGKGTGGGTSFEDMSHEQMLAWLDQANAGTVQGAADRLIAAAKEIRKIAEELKVRPQYVEWKGDGADAFRTWSGDLANSTLRLGDFSEGAAKWLGEASGAIATAQASIPRDKAGAQANLDAAQAAHNDPDAAAVSSKSTSELAALAADKEKVRQEAAAQMRKLGQTYSLSATQLDGLERPKFPPPPAAFVPPRDNAVEDLARPAPGSSAGVSGGGTASGVVGTAGTVRPEHGHAVTSGRLETEQFTSEAPSDHLRARTIEPVTHVGIDSATTLPGVHQPPAGAANGMPTPSRPDTGVPSAGSGMAPPFSGGAPRIPSASVGPGRSDVAGRTPARPGQRAVGSLPGRGATGVGPISSRNMPGSGVAPSRSVPGQGSGRGLPANSGITGGRPTATPSTGRPAGRLPGGTVVGNEPAGSRGSTAGPGGQAVARPAVGRPVGRSAPTLSNGVAGGTPQQTGRAPARPGAPVPSAPTRGGISGGTPSEAGNRRGARGGAAGQTGDARQAKQKRQTDRRGEAPTAD